LQYEVATYFSISTSYYIKSKPGRLKAAVASYVMYSPAFFYLNQAMVTVDGKGVVI